jgi:hypothetical protein
MNSVTVDLLVMERTKDTKWGYSGANTMVRENGKFSPTFLVMVGTYDP